MVVALDFRNFSVTITAIVPIKYITISNVLNLLPIITVATLLSPNPNTSTMWKYCKTGKNKNANGNKFLTIANPDFHKGIN